MTFPKQSTPRVSAEPPGIAFGDNLRAGLKKLVQARAYARDANRDPWDFALEIEDLFKTGLSVIDLRWLVAKGLVLHGQETSVSGDPHRTFHPAAGFHFTSATCLVLTDQGLASAGVILGDAAAVD